MREQKRRSKKQIERLGNGEPENRKEMRAAQFGLESLGVRGPERNGVVICVLNATFPLGPAPGEVARAVDGVSDAP